MLSDLCSIIYHEIPFVMHNDYCGIIQGQPQVQLIVANMALIADYLISWSKNFPYMTLFCDMGSKKFIQAYIFFKSNLIYAFGFLF